jgi:hypothetical protein
MWSGSISACDRSADLGVLADEGLMPRKSEMAGFLDFPQLDEPIPFLGAKQKIAIVFSI